MKDESKTFKVNIVLTTRGQVFVRANSLDEAIRAVQNDFDNGGYVLEPDILRIENEVPHDTAGAVSGEVETDCAAEYAVDASGSLKRICDHALRMGNRR